MGLARLLLAVTCLGILTLFIQAQPCATKTAIDITQGGYAFQYDSWVESAEENTRYLFKRGIKAKQPNRIWVDWKGTGIFGYSFGDGCHRHGVPSSHDFKKDVKTDLYYGAQANPIKTESSFIDVDQDKANKQGSLGGSLRSFVRMGLGLRPQTEEEQKKANIIDVHIEFEANAFYVGDKKYLYTVTWRNLLKGNEKQTVKVRWPDGSVVDKAFKNPPSPIFVSDEIIRIGSQQTGVTLSSAIPPKYELVDVKFLDSENREIGGTRVAVYTPVK